MKRTDIERIIKQGSTKQKIKLYFTDLAYFNTVGIKTVDITGEGLIVTKDEILTDRERELIYSSIKEPKDVKYYSELSSWNKAFLMYKPNITTYAKNFDYLTAQLSKYVTLRIVHKVYEDAINDILEIVEDKKLRETLVSTALKSLETFTANRYQKKGFLPFIIIPEANIDGKILLLVEVLNEKIVEAKEYIAGISTFLNKQLPLQPYKQFLKEEEDKIKANIEECRKHLEAYKLGRTVETPLDKIVEASTTKINSDITIPDEKYNILRWENVEVEVTDEDIEDIKRAGL